MEQNPREQNELRREETKVEVIRVGRLCSRQDCAAHPRLEGLGLLSSSEGSDSVSHLHARLLC